MNPLVELLMKWARPASPISSYYRTWSLQYDRSKIDAVVLELTSRIGLGGSPITWRWAVSFAEISTAYVDVLLTQIEKGMQEIATAEAIESAHARSSE